MIKLLIAGAFKLLLKGPESKYLRLVGHVVSVRATQRYHCSMKAVLDHR